LEGKAGKSRRAEVVARVETLRARSPLDGEDARLRDDGLKRAGCGVIF
jgi:hypothetical protein